MTEEITERLEKLCSVLRYASAEELPQVLNVAGLVEVSHDDLISIGVTFIGNSSSKIYATNPNKAIGRLRLEVAGDDALVVLDTDHRGGQLYGFIRISHENCNCIISTPDLGTANLLDVWLRSRQQTFFWGRGATAVGISIEIEGVGRGVFIGDDALISSGVWIRNHDMHAIVDLETGLVANADTIDTIIQPHVWIGQDALLLRCERVGYGSIVGARALARGAIPENSLVGGLPARVLRTGTSWSRAVNHSLSPSESNILNIMKERSQG